MKQGFLFDDQHGCTADIAIAQTLKGLVGLFQFEGLHFCPDACLGGERKKFLAIAAREIGNGSNGALSPQDGIRECGHIAHVDSCTHDSPAFGDMTKCLRYQCADRREQDGGIHLVGWL